MWKRSLLILAACVIILGFVNAFSNTRQSSRTAPVECEPVECDPAVSDPAVSDPADSTLFRNIATQDSLLFAAFNSRDLDRMKAYFSEDLEVYQDNVGVRSYEETIAAFGELFKKDYVLTRQLVDGSLEVYPIKDFGAIETGKHTFSHIENGKLEAATFKFVHIWEKKDGCWKITRLITYDHK
jgi:hypothetical protein